jgi:hypothetical protein
MALETEGDLDRARLLIDYLRGLSTGVRCPLASFDRAALLGASSLLARATGLPEYPPGSGVAPAGETLLDRLALLNQPSLDSLVRIRALLSEARVGDMALAFAAASTLGEAVPAVVGMIELLRALLLALVPLGEKLALFTCPICGKTSHNPGDLAHSYCGACHRFIGPFDVLAGGL